MGDWSGMAVIFWKSVKYQLVRKKAKKVGFRLMGNTNRLRKKARIIGMRLMGNTNRLRKKVGTVGMQLFGNTN